MLQRHRAGLGWPQEVVARVNCISDLKASHCDLRNSQEAVNSRSYLVPSQLEESYDRGVQNQPRLCGKDFLMGLFGTHISCR